MSSTVSNYPELLIVEPGQAIDGRYRRLERGFTKDGEERAIVVLEVDGVERSLWLHEKALRAQFRQLKPEANERVRVSKGAEKILGGNGFKYWPFKVMGLDRPDAELDWNDQLLGGDDELSAAPTPQTPETAPPAAAAETDIPF